MTTLLLQVPERRKLNLSYTQGPNIRVPFTCHLHIMKTKCKTTGEKEKQLRGWKRNPEHPVVLQQLRDTSTSAGDQTLTMLPHFIFWMLTKDLLIGAISAMAYAGNRPSTSEIRTCSQAGETETDSKARAKWDRWLFSKGDAHQCTKVIAKGRTNYSPRN